MGSLTGDKTGRLVQKEREGGWTNNTKIIFKTFKDLFYIYLKSHYYL